MGLRGHNRYQRVKSAWANLKERKMGFFAGLL